MKQDLRVIGGRLDAVSTPQVRHAAAQVLLQVADPRNEKCRATESSRVAQLDPSKQKNLLDCFGASSSPSVDILDGLISRGNVALHPSSLSELDMLVEDACACASDNLRLKLEWEFRVIDIYADIKTAFPLDFPS
jgi:hypothetical protein